MAFFPSPGRPCLDFNIKLYCAVGLMTTHADRKWLPRVVSTLFCFFILSLLINLIIVTIQCVREEKILRGAEVFQILFELIISVFVFSDFHLFVHRVYPLLLQMRTMFERTEPDVGALCRRTERKIFTILGALVFSVVSISYFKKIIFGMRPEQIALSSNLEKKSHPEKQLPFLLWLPVDDTVQPAYSVALLYNLFCLLQGAVVVFHLITYFPIISAHMQGYCESLASRLRTIGNPVDSATPLGIPATIAEPVSNPADNIAPLRNPPDNAAPLGHPANIADPLGNPVEIADPLYIPVDHVDTTMEQKISNSADPVVEQTLSSVSRYEPKAETIEPKSRQSRQIQDKGQVKRNRKKNKVHFVMTKYDATELIKLEALFRDHQEYLRLRYKLQEALKVSMIIKNFTNILLPICLCQLMLVRDVDSFIQMLMQYLLALAMSFSFVWSSELLDRGNDAIYKALYDNQWYCLHPSVAKYLVLMLGVSRRTKRLTYYGGALDICFPSFVAVLKVSYSLYVLLKNVLN